MSVFDGYVSRAQVLEGMGMVYCDGCSGWFDPDTGLNVQPSYLLGHTKWVNGELEHMNLCEGCVEHAEMKAKALNETEVNLKLQLNNLKLRMQIALGSTPRNNVWTRLIEHWIEDINYD